jgi:UDP-galactopyranose mutase
MRKVLVVGAGFAGAVMAERLASAGNLCTVVDKREHIGGNAYDYYDAAGVLTHKYGPHLFHTNSKGVLDYLTHFTEWREFRNTALSFTDGILYSFPINLCTFEQMVHHSSSTEEMEAYLQEHRVCIAHPKNSEEAMLSQVGKELYEKFYEGYTTKQWGRSPRELDASVCLRIPIRTSRNIDYFNDTYQCMPLNGYTEMFHRMFNHPNITTLLGVDYRNVKAKHDHTIYTGPVDEFFDCVYGALPYRSLRFEHTYYAEEFHQPVTAINYPNSEKFTRAVEIKHATGQVCKNTTVVREYPESVGEPYYPIPSPASAIVYQKYKQMAEQRKDVTFVGRLATYRYFNMDQVVAQALVAAEKIK